MPADERRYDLTRWFLRAVVGNENFKRRTRLPAECEQAPLQVPGLVIRADNDGDAVQVDVFPLLPVTSEPPADPYRILNSPDFDVLGCEYWPGGERYCTTMAPIIQTSAGRQFLITIRIAGLQWSANRFYSRRTSE